MNELTQLFEKGFGYLHLLNVPVYKIIVNLRRTLTDTILIN